mmetsp:Transcript_974/g.2381  ORF Transcript_974/g.2381 Transcript_974/m.2381 type:complete len:311 (-) Transcript_974:4265-5197(-)
MVYDSLSASQKCLIVVVGPTAVGKTALSVQLAKQFCSEIVSADARQCYQGMAIGTAQPTAEEMQYVPHHLVHCLPVQAPYNAGIFAQDALKILDNLWKKQDFVFMTGGAGLYIQAVCQGLDIIPSVDLSIRVHLHKKLQTEGLCTLVTALAKQDPTYYQTVDKTNPQRIMRALEVCLATGRPYSSFLKHQQVIRPFKVIKIGLTRARPVLYQRIEQRVEAMMDQGLMQEVIALYPYRHYNALQTIGYRELFGYLDGHYDLQEAVRLFKRNTRRYAKKQLTWLRRDKAIRWFSPEDSTTMLRYIQKTINML